MSEGFTRALRPGSRWACALAKAAKDITLHDLARDIATVIPRERRARRIVGMPMATGSHDGVDHPGSWCARRRTGGAQRKKFPRRG
jgi:hypothetical protein